MFGRYSRPAHMFTTNARASYIIRPAYNNKIAQYTNYYNRRSKMTLLR